MEIYRYTFFIDKLGVLNSQGYITSVFSNIWFIQRDIVDTSIDVIGVQFRICDKIGKYTNANLYLDR